MRTIEAEGYPFFAHDLNTCFLILPLYSIASKSWNCGPSGPMVGRSDPEASSKPSSRVPQKASTEMGGYRVEIRNK